MAPQRELKGQQPGPLFWVIPYTTEAIYLRKSTTLHVASAWGEASPHLQESLLPHSVELKPGCWVQLEAISVLSVTEGLQATVDL